MRKVECKIDKDGQYILPFESSEYQHDSIGQLSALSIQEGGDHYKTLAFQPVEYILANDLGFIEGAVIKYVTRWKDKGGVGDLRKARHFLDILIEYSERRGI